MLRHSKLTCRTNQPGTTLIKTGEIMENTENTLQATTGQPSAGARADDMEFGLLMNRVMGGAPTSRPSDKSANDVQVDILLGQAGSLTKLNDQYTQTFVVKGTKALYDLLGAIYSYALQIDGSPLRDHVLQRMRDQLQETHDVKTQANSPWITTIVRFILPSDRQTAYTYARVVQIAFDENLTATELPAYIRDRGGISKITATKESEEAAKAIKDHKAAKLTLTRKVLLANAKASNLVAGPEPKKYLNVVPEGKKQGTFDLAICVNVGQEVKIVRFLQVSEQMEASVLAAIADASLPDDLDAVQAKLDEYRERLGINSGWGMEPGDKGYALPNMPVIAPVQTQQPTGESQVSAQADTQAAQSTTPQTVDQQ